MSRSFSSAATLDDALSAIAAGARPVAGGTDLVVGARQGKAALPWAIVAIDRIDALRGIAHTGEHTTVGALVTHEDLVADATVRERLTAIADACAIVGSHATRAQGTIGGNVMNASPAMDAGGPLLCFDATAILRSQAGERTVGLAELWTGPGSTVASPQELLTSIHVPTPAVGTGSAYVRLEYRRQMEIAVVGATVTLRSASGERTLGLDELWTGPGQTVATPQELLTAVQVPVPASGTGSAYVRLEYRRQMEISVVGATAVVTVEGDRVTEARIAITALAPTIRRVPEAEAALAGTDGGTDAVAVAAAAAASASVPISDVRGSAAYRTAMAEVMARRAIGAALTRARGGSVPIPASPALHGAN